MFKKWRIVLKLKITYYRFSSNSEGINILQFVSKNKLQDLKTKMCKIILNGFWWGSPRVKKERKLYLCFYSKPTFRKFLPSFFMVLKGQGREYKTWHYPLSPLLGAVTIFYNISLSREFSVVTLFYCFINMEFSNWLKHHHRDHKIHNGDLFDYYF